VADSGVRTAEIGAAAARDHDLPPGLLDGYLDALVVVARTGHRLSRAQEDECRRLGAQAAEAGVTLPAMVDLYMTASGRLWPRLPELVPGPQGTPMRAGALIAMGEAVWRAADTALAALATGHLQSQQQTVRREEAFRREFVDDLLSGRSAVGSLVERAQRLGLTLSAPHLVIITEVEGHVDAGTRGVGAVEEAVRARMGARGLLVAAKDGRLVCVLSAGPRGAADGRLLAEIAGSVVDGLTRGAAWRTAVGRPHAGPQGVVLSYREAQEALDVGGRLGLPGRVVEARDLLVYRVLLRDEEAIADLVETVLGPLAAARGGAGPLLETLETYFATGGNAADTARRLHLSVRAVTYRLDRVRQLTGRSAADPTQHLTLLVAVTGARLLAWPGDR
jgi:sugar diacid utilization regulator